MIKKSSLLKLLTVSLLLIFSISYASEETVITWEKTFGGDKWDKANSIQQVADGGYIVAGGTSSFGVGSTDVYVFKLDENGNLIWQKIYGGSGSDLAYSIQQTTDGGYIVAGITASLGAGSYDVYVLKLDKDGNLIWEKAYGGSAPEEAYAVQETKDGGYIVAGRTASFGDTGNSAYPLNNVYVLKLDKDGNLIWQKTYGGSDNDWARSIQETKDGGYIIAGITGSISAGFNAYILKIDKDGNLVWDKKYGRDSGEAYAVQQTKDGGYIVAGGTASFGPGWNNVYVLKLDTNGDLIWEKAYGRKKVNWGYAVQETKDGGYIVAGKSTDPETESDDIYILKLDANGDLIWQKIYGTYSDEIAYAVQETKDGGYIVASNVGEDIYILKLDANGNLK